MDSVKASLGRLWLKVKSVPWAVWIAAAIAGLMFTLSAAGIARSNAKSKSLEHRAEKNAAAGATRHLEKAARLTQKAESIKQKTEAKKIAAAARLDKIGESDEDLEALVDSWNASRVHKPGGNPPT